MDNIPMRPPKLPGYDFVQMLGSGATATVYLYNQRMPARPVAVKASAKTLAPRAAALFNREANFMAKLSSHPYILPVYGAGVTSDGHGYIVIEYAPGGTYNSIMKARSMTCEQVLDLGIKLSSALFTAHRSNIIHHDIKPSNILITSQGLPVLGDFGISTDVYDRTETGFSPPWAPPEVLQHLTNGSEAADIYSLAGTLYAMFGGGDLSADSIPSAIALFLLGKGDVKKTLEYCVNFGGDCDTNGAMAGAMVGAMAGIDAVPQVWRDKISEMNACNFAKDADEILALIPQWHVASESDVADLIKE